MENEFRARCYSNRHSPLPAFLLLFGVLCALFALLFDFGRLVDVLTPEGIQIGFFPAGSMVTDSAETQSLATVQACNLIAWIAAIVLPAVCLRRDAEAAAQKMAVAHGQRRCIFELASYFSQTALLQCWYLALNVVLIGISGSMLRLISLGYLYRAALLWLQGALVLQGFFSLNRLVGLASCSEMILAAFGFLEVVVGLVVAASYKSNPPFFSRVILSATPMPHWLALGACNSAWSAILRYSVITVLLAEACALLLAEGREIK